MIITKRKIVIVVFIALFLLAISPYSNAQERANPPSNTPVAAVEGEKTKKEIVYLVQDLVANVATKLRTAINRTEQILGRLNSRREKLASPENNLSDVAEFADKADRLLAEAVKSLENIEVDAVKIFESEKNLQESWKMIGLRFSQARKNIRLAHQNIFEAALVLLSISTDEIAPGEPYGGTDN